MGQDMGIAVRLPWDVPVRLVPSDASPHAERQVVRVALGFDLPGVRALEVTLVTAGRTRALERIARCGPVGQGRDAGASRVDDLAALLAGMADGDRSVPVLVDGTSFTRAVLTALTRVSAGQRVTYAALAASAGRPRAIRAAASVMARNRVPLVLPCHRVVPSSGGTGRYAWGETVKAALLAAEAAR